MNAAMQNSPQRVVAHGAQAPVRNNPTTNRNTVKPLAITFRADGFQFNLLNRIGPVALFEKRKRPNDAPSFEVVKIRRLPARTLFGIECPASEAMPASERWGVDGWTYSNLDSARAKFQALTEAQDSPASCTRQGVNRVSCPETVGSIPIS